MRIAVALLLLVSACAGTPWYPTNSGPYRPSAPGRTGMSDAYATEQTSGSQAAQATERAIACLGLRPCAEQPASVGVTVRGRVVAGTFAAHPVGFALVRLRRGQDELASTTTDGAGSFAFRQRLEAGQYQLVLESDRYEGEAAFSYEHRDVEVSVLARSRAP